MCLPARMAPREAKGWRAGAGSIIPHRMRAALTLMLPLALLACGPRYSPDAYATRAVQQMNRVEQGVVIGRRGVVVQMEGTTGAATGGAAGGIIGSQTPGGNMAGAIGAVGGALVGGLFGTAAERVAGDTTAYEYIVRKSDGELVSVTQRDETPLEVGLRVLVIGGAQARIIADYTRPGEPAPTRLPVEPPAPRAEPPAATAAEAPAASPAEPAASSPDPAPEPAEPTISAPTPDPEAAEALPPAS
jgi:outer membrane lipoprotein SlyB